MLRLPPASAQATHPSSCRERQASVAALRLLFPRQTLRWFASERPLRGRFSFASDFQQCRGDSKGGGAPFESSRKRGSRGRNPIERVSPPVRFFGYFLSAQKVTRGTGAEPPKRQRVAEQPALCSYFTSPNSAQVLLSVINTSAYRPMREASPRRWTSRPPLVRLERGQRASPLSPSTSTRTVWPT